MDRYKGYTLIELVIVLALFSLLLTIAVPNFKALNRVDQLKELKEFRRDVLYARNQTIVTGVIHIVNLDYENNYYNITANAKTIKSHYFKSGIKLVKNVFNHESKAVTEVQFAKNGALEQGVSIYLEDHNRKEYRLSITPVTTKITLYMDGEKL